jgi:hypothetical protein
MTTADSGPEREPSLPNSLDDASFCSYWPEISSRTTALDDVDVLVEWRFLCGREVVAEADGARLKFSRLLLF